MSHTIDEIQNLINNIMQPKDTFQFNCTMCGKCCRKREEPILITGLDLFRIAKTLNMTTMQVIEKHTDRYIGAQSHVPILTLKERLDGSCSLLRKGHCMVHSNKPVVCALYPLGRMYNSITDEFQYFQQITPCNTGAKTWTLQEWLNEFKISELDEESRAWNKLLMGPTMVTSQIDKDKLPDEMMAVIANAFYFNYDITKPYLEQAQLNMAQLKVLFKIIFNKEIDYNI